MCFFCVLQAGLEHLGSSNLSASALCVAGTADPCHIFLCARVVLGTGTQGLFHAKHVGLVCGRFVYFYGHVWGQRSLSGVFLDCYLNVCIYVYILYVSMHSVCMS